MAKAILAARIVIEVRVPGDWDDAKLDRFCDKAVDGLEGSLQAIAEDALQGWGATVTIDSGPKF